ncbi:hypothetical protein E1162_07080 [Rhodobacteraceae bacterium RKSG542]|uniref:DUF6030 family protein n=1 Tax=Pseudovibrio flavus TaxID=2529854 RepID=UPI0012BB686B|nr:hypothetical protein [Pseudovibrio flavus]
MARAKNGQDAKAPRSSRAEQPYRGFIVRRLIIICWYALILVAAPVSAIWAVTAYFAEEPVVSRPEAISLSEYYSKAKVADKNKVEPKRDDPLYRRSLDSVGMLWPSRDPSALCSAFEEAGISLSPWQQAPLLEGHFTCVSPLVVFARQDAGALSDGGDETTENGPEQVTLFVALRGRTALQVDIIRFQIEGSDAASLRLAKQNLVSIISRSLPQLMQPVSLQWQQALLGSQRWEEEHSHLHLAVLPNRTGTGQSEVGGRKNYGLNLVLELKTPVFFDGSRRLKRYR